MKDRYKISKLLFTSLMLFFLIMGCSSGADDDETTGDDTQNAASIAIGISGSSVKSDDSDSVTVTASILDANNAAVEDVTVRFTADSGALSAASAVTDSNGAAEVSSHSGLVDQSNRTATITATLGDLSALVPVQVIGTTVTVNQDSSTLSSSDASSNLEIYVTDASGDGIYNAEFSITVSSASTGTVSLSAASGYTGVDGTYDITVTGVASGSVTLDIDAGGASTSCTYSVETTGNILQITSPTDSPATLAIGNSLKVIVSDPSGGSVVISTTLGILNDTGKAVTLDASSGTAEATLTTTESGTATIQAYNTSAPSITDSISVAMYAPASAASQIAVQASSTVVALSTADLKNSVEITARVTDASGNPVGSAPVVFSMSNTPGGGEKLSPSVVFSDTSGEAVTTFTSGSISTSGAGLTITAELLANSSIDDSIDIIIGGTSGSVSITESTTVESVNDDTAYRMPVSVIVSDSNGNPVPGAIVTINLWPEAYYTGDCVYGIGLCYGPYANEDDFFSPENGYAANDDRYRNQYLDTGEDTNGDGQLTPPISSAGTMPATVEADENGVGTFSWYYGKDYAGYVRAEIKASTMVLGSETTTTVLKRLRPSQDDVEDEVLPGVSPFIAP
jgi:hypothetical protein